MNIIFVGDYYQLLPVGGGKPIAFKRTSELKTNHRFKDDPS